jgi:hypothetical protein
MARDYSKTGLYVRDARSIKHPKVGYSQAEHLILVAEEAVEIVSHFHSSLLCANPR